MLTSLEMKLEGSDKGARFSPHFGSLLHGVLMENLAPAYADYLHGNALKPYSQFIWHDRERGAWIWKINTLTREARQHIIAPLLQSSRPDFLVKQKNLQVNILEKKLSAEISYKALAERLFLSQGVNRQAVVRFLTPATFKMQGEYSIFPHVQNIYGSLLNRWNDFHSDISLDDRDVLGHLTEHTRMIGYDLCSTRYGMEKVRIHSFMGEACFHVSGPLNLVRIARLLFAFGEFAGIGAKTALGMGGINVYE
jgi:CRISPR-associated endoribonuclease Cas6